MADSEWEGVRYWDAFYHHDKTHECEKGARNEQPVAMSISKYGRMTVYAHVQTLHAANDTRRRSTTATDERRYILGLLCVDVCVMCVDVCIMCVVCVCFVVCVCEE